MPKTLKELQIKYPTHFIYLQTENYTHRIDPHSEVLDCYVPITDVVEQGNTVRAVVRENAMRTGLCTPSKWKFCTLYDLQIKDDKRVSLIDESTDSVIDVVSNSNIDKLGNIQVKTIEGSDVAYTDVSDVHYVIDKTNNKELREQLVKYTAELLQDYPRYRIEVGNGPEDNTLSIQIEILE